MVKNDYGHKICSAYYRAVYSVRRNERKMTNFPTRPAAKHCPFLKMAVTVLLPIVIRARVKNDKVYAAVVRLNERLTMEHYTRFSLSSRARFYYVILARARAYKKPRYDSNGRRHGPRLQNNGRLNFYSLMILIGLHRRRCKLGGEITTPE